MSAVGARQRRARAALESSVDRSVFVYEHADPSGESFAWLRERRMQVAVGPATWDTEFLDVEQVVARGQGSHALMGGSTLRIDGTVFERMQSVAVVSKYGRGTDSIDIEAASHYGVLVTNTPVTENIETVAETTVAMMLVLQKQLLFYTTERLRQGGWRSLEALGSSLRGKRVGLIGFGAVGQAVARRLSGWECVIDVYDPYVTAWPRTVNAVSLDRLLAEADVVSVHAVATAETEHLINATTLALMKPQGVIVNTARGSLVDLDALYVALRDGRIAGAALDAFEDEPPPAAHPILTLPNVLATPHIAAWNRTALQQISQVGAENVWAALTGQTPKHMVNPHVLETR
jgi:D-3-phosphoglycerate dehydrogenase